MTRWARAGITKSASTHQASTWKDLQKQKATSKVNDPSAQKSLLLESWRQEQLQNAEETAVKKDKRRENRRLKRVRQMEAKKVCFHCRMPGHGMADCPMLKDDVEQGTDICFKCGSTEHKATVCTAKVTKGKEFLFAKCFVCGEVGHLSKSCPDNPRGLYPDGGCCQLCGSVEHYKKDCPDRKVKNEVTAYRFKSVAPPSAGIDRKRSRAVHVSVDDEMSLYEDVDPAPKVAKMKKKVVRF